MAVAFAIFLVLHGLIHVVGFAKAVAPARLPQLVHPIPFATGALWLLAAILFLTSAAMLFASPRWWWAVGLCALAISTLAIVPSWGDARFGAAANVLVFVGVAFGFLAHGPFSLLAAYERDVEAGLANEAPSDVITNGDLGHLPPAVQRYLRTAGVVGRPRVRNFRVRMHGRIRSGAGAQWIPINAEQHNFIDEPARFFYLSGSMFAIPVQGYHRYAGRSATMRVKAGALFPVVDASGEEMTASETVTLFNDMCVMAPSTLVEAPIRWDPVDAHTVRAVFTNAGHTIRAELQFNDAGELIDFWSDDRYQTAPDGRSAKRVRWSTPLGGYRPFGSVRLAARGEGKWHESGGEYSYIELVLDDVEYNLRRRGRSQS